MSNIYIQEPPTNGKILLKTTVGDIDIELWSKEAPLACKNFVQHCLDGYYDNTIFHRVVKGFIVQGGDPTGTGTGGESIYGEPFKDEIHSRLRFNRRGLVAMANAGKNDNGSQFFFTLGATPELQKKHTIFGKVAGKTIYNMIKLEDGEIDSDERPLYPNKIVGTEVLNNPYPDLEPRVMKTSKSSEEKTSKKKAPQAVKNFKLLSFGEEAEEDEEEIEEINQNFQGKKKHVPTLIEADDESTDLKRKLQEDVDSDHDSDSQPEDSISDNSVMDKIRSKLNPNKKQAVGKNLSKKNVVEHFEDERDESTKKLKWKKEKTPPPKVEPEKKNNVLMDEYLKEKSKYDDMKRFLPKKGESREKQTLEMLMKFRQKINKLQQQDPTELEKEKKSDGEEEDWLVHSLKCEDSVVIAKDANKKDDDWFEITDPRNVLNKRRRENSKMNKSRVKEELK